MSFSAQDTLEGAGSRFQATGNLVTSWSVPTLDTNYPSEKLVYDSLAAKQVTLVSGTNIKTINSTSLLGSGNIAISGGISASSTDTLTNKRITNRVLSEASNTSITINSDNYDVYEVSALTAATVINNPTGTPTNMQILEIVIASSTTTARAITYGTNIISSNIVLPTTTTATTVPITITLQYHSNYAGGAKWVCKGVA